MAAILDFQNGEKTWLTFCNISASKAVSSENQPCMCQRRGDLIKASREVHQSVIDAYTEILHCHYSCWIHCHFLDKDHAIYHCNLPTMVRGICISLYGLWGLHLTVGLLLLFLVLSTSQVHG